MADLKAAVQILKLGFNVIGAANRTAEDECMFTIFEIAQRCGSDVPYIHVRHSDLEAIAEACGAEIRPSEEFTWRDEAVIDGMYFLATNKEDLWSTH